MNEIDCVKLESQVSTTLAPNSEVELIQSWLQEYHHNRHTYRAYVQAMKKLLAWLKQRQVSLQQVDIVQARSYVECLQNPPQSWLEKKLLKQPMSKAGVKQHLRILHSLYKYLIESGYVERNPFKVLRQFQGKHDNVQQKYQIQSKVLEPEDIALLAKALQQLPTDTHVRRLQQVRAKLIVAMFFHLGLRISELASARWSSFHQQRGQWWYFLHGKGGKPAQIPVSQDLLEVASSYRAYYGLSSDIATAENGFVRRLKNRFHRYLVRGMACGHAQTMRTCEKIDAEGRSLWLFLERPEVPFTNNHAERLLRPLVIAKKISFGVQAVRGARFIERLYSVIQTCKLQGQDVLGNLHECIQAYFCSHPPKVDFI